ncbi:MAG: hypothetical protein ACYDA5_07960 [Vulcanimicrobiaceae bacterium]
MNAAFQIAREYGVKIEFADLGEWGVDELRSEYDPDVPAIRLNARIVEALPLADVGEFIMLAVGHEIYHHRERIGEIERLPDRPAREVAANDFARRLLPDT